MRQQTASTSSWPICQMWMNVPPQITIEELVEAQTYDNFSNEIRSALNRGDTVRFRDNPDTGILERISPEGHKAVIPEVLQLRLLHLAHYPQVSGHPGGRKMYQTMRKQFYWPGMALSCYQAVRACPACARERIKLQSNSTTMKLFPLSGPLEDVAMDLL
eukprot:IDg22587t1